jgi:hypothetical protein
METIQPAQAAQETIRETFENDKNLSGTFVIFCIGDKIEMKARGLTPWQIVKMLCLLISRIL